MHVSCRMGIFVRAATSATDSPLPSRACRNRRPTPMPVSSRHHARRRQLLQAGEESSRKPGAKSRRLASAGRGCSRDTLKTPMPRTLLTSDHGFAMPPEWSPHAATWMGWPCDDDLWIGELEPVRREFADLVRAVAAFEPVE